VAAFAWLRAAVGPAFGLVLGAAVLLGAFALWTLAVHLLLD
jgi:hypothetical protein